jgi:hypothetical protein
MVGIRPLRQCQARIDPEALAHHSQSMLPNGNTLVEISPSWIWLLGGPLARL